VPWLEDGSVTAKDIPKAGSLRLDFAHFSLSNLREDLDGTKWLNGDHWTFPSLPGAVKVRYPAVRSWEEQDRHFFTVTVRVIRDDPRRARRHRVQDRHRGAGTVLPRVVLRIRRAGGTSRERAGAGTSGHRPVDEHQPVRQRRPAPASEQQHVVPRLYEAVSPGPAASLTARRDRHRLRAASAGHAANFIDPDVIPCLPRRAGNHGPHRRADRYRWHDLEGLG
jgi:hypothetical protein